MSPTTPTTHTHTSFCQQQQQQLRTLITHILSTHAHISREWEQEKSHLQNSIKDLHHQYKTAVREQEARYTVMARENRMWRESTFARGGEGSTSSGGAVYDVAVEDELALLRSEVRKLEGKVKERESVVKALHEHVLKAGDEITVLRKKEMGFRDVIAGLKENSGYEVIEKEKRINELEVNLQNEGQLKRFWYGVVSDEEEGRLWEGVEEMVRLRDEMFGEASGKIRVLEEELREKEKRIVASERRRIDIENELDEVLFFELRARHREPELQARIEGMQRWAEARDAENGRLKMIVDDMEMYAGSGEGAAELIAKLNEQITGSEAQVVRLQSENTELRERIDGLEWKLGQYGGDFKEKEEGEANWRERTQTNIVPAFEDEDEQLVRVARQVDAKGVGDCSAFPGVGKRGEPVVCEAFYALRKIYPECYHDAGRFRELKMAIPVIELYTWTDARLEREMREGDKLLQNGEWSTPRLRVAKAETPLEGGVSELARAFDDDWEHVDKENEWEDGCGSGEESDSSDSPLDLEEAFNEDSLEGNLKNDEGSSETNSEFDYEACLSANGWGDFISKKKYAGQQKGDGASSTAPSASLNYDNAIAEEEKPKKYNADNDCTGLDIASNEFDELPDFAKRKYRQVNEMAKAVLEPRR